LAANLNLIHRVILIEFPTNSVSRWMDGDSGEVDINVVVSRVIDCRVLYVAPSWEKSWKDPVTNNTTMDSTARKLDVSFPYQLVIIPKLNISLLPGVHKIPIDWERAPPYIREKYLDKYYEYRNYTTGSKTVHEGKLNIDQVLKFILGVNEKTCAE
jgi:hypothetical protein